MNQQQYIISIDMGTTAFKAAIFDSTGTELASATEEYLLSTPYPGWAELEPAEYVNLFKKVTSSAMQKAAVPKEQIVSLGLSVALETSIFLDENMQSIRPAIAWLDMRATEESGEIVDEFGATKIQRHTGQVGKNPVWPGAKLLWIKKHEPEIFNKLSMILQLNGYFSYLLTGTIAEDDSLLCSTIYWDINTRGYWDEMLEYIGLTKSQLPSIIESGTLVGTITPEAAAEFGFSEKMTVNIGGSDLACGTVGCGTIKAGTFSESTGSALCTMAMSDHVVLDPNKQIPCYCGVLPNTYIFHAFSTGGMSIKWFRDCFAELELQREAEGDLNAFDQLDILAASVPAGSEGLIALPHLQGSGPPDLDAKAKACFYGMTMAHGKAHFIRALMESVVMVFRRITDETEALDIPVEKIISFGGGSLSPLWCQMKADATGKQVITTVNNKSAGCLGAAILAGVSCGIWDSVEAACEEAIVEDKVYTPNPELKETYDGLLKKYVSLMECLKPMIE